MGSCRGNAFRCDLLPRLQVQPLISPPTTILAVHDGPPGRGARGVQVRIGIVHWPYHASIEANDRRTCARRGVTVYARSSIPKGPESRHAGGALPRSAGCPVRTGKATLGWA